MTDSLSPIAIFAYNRPHQLKRLLESLVACAEFERSPVTIFVDGPRSPSDEAAVAEVRALVQSLPFANVRGRFAAANLGLRRSIYAGVSAICEDAGRAIVLEDDLILSPFTLEYFNNALTKYAEQSRVWSISGYAYDAPALAGRTKALVLPFAHPWGWATWQRAWTQFPAEIDFDARDLSSPSFKSRFDLDGLYPFTRLLGLAHDGLIDSWFIRWYYTIFQHGGTSIFPPQRLVKNYGIVGGGTHSGKLNPYDLLVRRPPELMNQSVELPDALTDDHWALDLMKYSWETSIHRFISDGGAIKRRLRTRR